jgi:hypothetical protein
MPAVRCAHRSPFSSSSKQIRRTHQDTSPGWSRSSGSSRLLAGRHCKRCPRFALACAAAVSVAVAASRLYLGVHWITDALGGTLLGALATSLGGALANYLQSDEGHAPSPQGDVASGASK